MKSTRRNSICYTISLFLIFFLTSIGEARETIDGEIPIVVVIPSYNNRPWYKKNLDSVFSQEYNNYRVIYIDDASTDDTGRLVQEYIQESGQTHRTTFIHNRQNIKPLANIYTAVSQCEPHEVIAHLDGDDWFSHNRVLQKLNEVYSDPDVWVTYGQFIGYPTSEPGIAREFPKEIIASNGYRDYPWISSHLRSYYAGLFQKISKVDMLYQGSFYPMTGDLASMYPILEMAGNHIRFIPDILYVYNIATNLNEGLVNRPLQEHLEHHIRARKRYKPIEKPY